MKNDNFTIVIPSRFGSKRMPGKSLVNIKGKTMIQRVYEQCKKSNASHIIIATDDIRISDVVQDFTSDVELTSINHRSGTDRIFEVVDKLQLDDDHVIVNVQGDEPLIPPALINQVANNIARIPNINIATLCTDINNISDFINPNIVKVQRGRNNFAHLFSRAPIPFNKNWKNLIDLTNFDDSNVSYPIGLRHIGIYAYTYKSLKNFVSLDHTQSEITESLEQMRGLDNGMKIHCDNAVEKPQSGIDTDDDLYKVITYLDEKSP